MEVINLMIETGMSSIEAVVHFNISSSKTVRAWRNQFETGGFTALVSKEKGRPSVKKEMKNTREHTNRIVCECSYKLSKQTKFL